MRWNRSLVLLVASVGDTRVLWTFSSSTCSKRINGAVNVQHLRFQQEMFRHGNHDLTAVTAVTAVAVDSRKSTLQKFMEHLASVTLSLRRCSRNLCQVTQVVCQMAMEMVCICGKKNSDLPLLCPPVGSDMASRGLFQAMEKLKTPQFRLVDFFALGQGMPEEVGSGIGGFGSALLNPNRNPNDPQMEFVCVCGRWFP